MDESLSMTSPGTDERSVTLDRALSRLALCRSAAQRRLSGLVCDALRLADTRDMNSDSSMVLSFSVRWQGADRRNDCSRSRTDPQRDLILLFRLKWVLV